mmetsp:Transcript_3117/g.7072  ORF Transcript_3117/g.7072 Transcript_3117/m.7072 type:complete len:134 (-) Transcript_3117:414-815(-)
MVHHLQSQDAATAWQASAPPGDATWPPFAHAVSSPCPDHFCDPSGCVPPAEEVTNASLKPWQPTARRAFSRRNSKQAERDETPQCSHEGNSERSRQGSAISWRVSSGAAPPPPLFSNRLHDTETQQWGNRQAA